MEFWNKKKFKIGYDKITEMGILQITIPWNDCIDRIILCFLLATRVNMPQTCSTQLSMAHTCSTQVKYKLFLLSITFKLWQKKKIMEKPTECQRQSVIENLYKFTAFLIIVTN